MWARDDYAKSNRLIPEPLFNRISDSKQDSNDRSQFSKFQLDISLPTNGLHGYGRGNDRNTIMHVVKGFSNRLQHR